MLQNLEHEYNNVTDLLNGIIYSGDEETISFATFQLAVLKNILQDKMPDEVEVN